MRGRALKNHYLITICGPTGIGKTDWAIRLALHYQTEILSADSRQFYREMQIGTAVPTAAELQRATHHFIQHRSIFEPYSVGDFEKDARARLDRLFHHHSVVIMVGGSGLYLDAVTRGLDVFPEVPSQVREELDALYREKGLEGLQELLAKLDPAYHKTVDLKNPHRLIRALGVCLASGKAYSSFRGKRKAPTDFVHVPLGIAAPREVVYERIEKRVDQMMEQGLLGEAEALYPHRDRIALQTVGYQELFAYIEGRWDLETAVGEIKKNTRRFAKRQGTWFRRNPDIHWIPFDAPTEAALRYLNEKINTTTHE
jgi:tRNA dimethylallyltransferase